jgi:hypothetical protein
LIKVTHLHEDRESNIQLLSRKKFRVLAELNNWSLAYAEGYFNGKAHRVLGKHPPRYALIGIDQYPAGFRAGYFERQTPDSNRQSA